MRRTMLLSILALIAGCEPQIDQSAQSLAVYPIPGLGAGVHSGKEVQE